MTKKCSKTSQTSKGRSSLKKHGCKTIKKQMVVRRTASEKPQRKKFKKCKDADVYPNSRIQKAVMARAHDIAAAKVPSEISKEFKVMLPSHVRPPFWLGLDEEYRKHLTFEGLADEKIVLEDENGKPFETKYLGRRKGLSGGWAGFSKYHELLEGDVLTFTFVEKRKWKIYIVRHQDVVGELNINPAGSDLSEEDVGELTPADLSDEDVSLDSEDYRLFDISRKDNETDDADSDDVGPLLLKGVGCNLDDDPAPFSRVRSMKEFNVIYNGLNLNSKLPQPMLTKYYELCRTKSSYLHENLQKNCNCEFVAGLICETVRISDAITACEITSSESDFSKWDETLQGMEMFRMNVCFLRTQIQKLADLSAELRKCKVKLDAHFRQAKSAPFS